MCLCAQIGLLFEKLQLHKISRDSLVAYVYASDAEKSRRKQKQYLCMRGCTPSNNCHRCNLLTSAYVEPRTVQKVVDIQH